MSAVLTDHIKLLKAEEYVMKRTVYKLCNQFRNEKSLHGLRKVWLNLICFRKI